MLSHKPFDKALAAFHMADTHEVSAFKLRLHGAVQLGSQPIPIYS